MAGARSDCPQGTRRAPGGGELVPLPVAPGLALHWCAPLLPSAEADRLLAELCEQLPWEQPRVRVFGRYRRVSRLQSWHGDPDTEYRYSGLRLAPRPWTPGLARVRDLVEALLDEPFNSVLANLYRDGRDTIGWHADDEPELGARPLIASVSLGATRDLALRRRGETRMHSRVALVHNSLLVMPAGMQAHWEHALPRRARIAEPRLNLTLRRIQGG